MVVLALVGATLLALAIIAREFQLKRDRAAQHALIAQLRGELARTKEQSQRMQEDFYVLQTLLAERNLLDEGELARGRVRLVDNPKRAAAEKEALVRRLGVSPTQLVLDESADKVH